MPYHHLAHLDSFDKHIKKGTKIRRGDPIGKVGATGTRYAHLHYEVMKVKPVSWGQYNNGMTKEQTEARYADPYQWIDKSKKIPAPYTTYGGWDWLDVRSKRGEVHPGVDINDGYGMDDKGNPIVSPCEGEVVYKGTMNGWGNHLWIYESDTEPHPVIDWDFAKELGSREMPFFLQVEAHGEAWYVNPEGKRFYIGGTPEEMLQFVREMSEGISNADLNKLPYGKENPN